VPFSVCLANNDLNSFKTYLQIEPADLDVSVYGHYFPVYGVDAVSGYSAALDHIKTFFSLNSSNPYGRVTTTRFNIEYYNPLTSSNSIYKRVRWVGVPGLQFYVNHKLVVPLDYRSIVLSYYTKGYFAYTSGFPVLTTDGSSPNMVCTITFLGDPNFATIYNEVNLGDIIEVTAGAGAKFFGIVRSTSLESSTIIAEQWKSTRYSTTMSSSTAVTGFAYHNAMFPGIININQLVYDRFSVTENMEVQNSVSELDLYS